MQAASTTALTRKSSRQRGMKGTQDPEQREDGVASPLLSYSSPIAGSSNSPMTLSSQAAERNVPVSLRSPEVEKVPPVRASIPSPEPIPHCPPPWTTRGDIYCFLFWTSKAKAESIPKEYLFCPLELHSTFASSEASKPAGGLGFIQVIRYRDSPVGPYDELLLVPGLYEWERQGPEGRKKGKNFKISKIFVSQKHTCYNGRRNWNIPKCLARFDWQSSPDGSTTVKVFPHDAAEGQHESCPSPEPFFQMTFKPVRFAPRFPLSLDWANWLGIDTTAVMPPLPAGSGSQGELPGTDRWCSFKPYEYSRRTALTWFNVTRPDRSDQVVGGGEKLWPGLGGRRLGIMMEDAELVFLDPLETWEDAASAASGP